jgi:hypothetical protein
VIHRLVLVARPGHYHPAQPTCECGWAGIPSRRRLALTQYREHRESVERKGRGGGARAQGGPRPLTPVEELPEALR